MKIDRVALRGAAQQALADNETRHAERLVAWDRYLIEHKAEWMERWGPTWISTVANIEKALRAGEPVTESLIPDRYNAVYRDPTATNGLPYAKNGITKPTPEYIPNRELVALVEVLNLIKDDEVTITDLNRLGITAKTLRETLLQLGNNAKATI